MFLDKPGGLIDYDTALKLDKLRGFGPWFAFATPVFFGLAFATFVIITSSITYTGTGPDRKVSIPGWFDLGAAMLVLLLGLSMLTGLIVALDLEWIEHPRAHSGLTYVGLGAMAVSTLSFFIVLIQLSFFSSSGTSITAFFFVAGLGLYLVAMNWVAMRAHLLGPGLPWLGMVSGALFLLASLGAFGVDFTSIGFIGAVPLYLAWAIWLGFRLRGPTPADAAPAS